LTQICVVLKVCDVGLVLSSWCFF